MHARHLMKFLHTMGAIGMLGSMACLLVMMGFLPDPQSATAQYASVRAAMGGIANYIFLPSLVITLVAGLMAIALNKIYMHAGWSLTKLVSGIVVFEGSLIAVHGPMKREAELGADVLAGKAEAAQLAASLGSEWVSLWIVSAVAVLNVVLGVWRPRFSRRSKSAQTSTSPQA